MAHTSKDFFVIPRSFWTDNRFKKEKFSRTLAFFYLASFLADSSGKLLVSLRELSEAWQWSRSAVHRFLRNLIRQGVIARMESDTANKGTVYVICKYALYPIGKFDARLVR